MNHLSPQMIFFSFLVLINTFKTYIQLWFVSHSFKMFSLIVGLINLQFYWFSHKISLELELGTQKTQKPCFNACLPRYVEYSMAVEEHTRFDLTRITTTQQISPCLALILISLPLPSLHPCPTFVPLPYSAMTTSPITVTRLLPSLYLPHFYPT